MTEAGARIVSEVLPTADEAATRVLGKLWNAEEQQQAPRVAAARAPLVQTRAMRIALLGTGTMGAPMAQHLGR